MKWSVVLHRSHTYRAYQAFRNAERINPVMARARLANDTSVAFTPNTDEMVRLYRRRLAVFEKPSSAWIEGGWVRTREILAEMQRYLGERGIPLVLFVIPEQMQVNQRLMTRLAERKTPEELERLDMRLPQERLAEIGDALGIEVVDPLDAFAEQGRDLMLYFVENAHWNVAGNLLGGHILAEQLVERGLVPVASIPPLPDLDDLPENGAD